jgi:hypothetical protein
MTKTAKKEKLGSILLRAWGRGKVTLLTVVVALTLAIVSPALAATGGNFLLGVANTATATSTATGITQLTANIANPAMKLINTSTSAGATALNLQTATTKPPMTVNSKTKVTNLNADQVDGKDFSHVRADGNVMDDPIDNFTSGSYTSTISRSITAPSAGFLHLTGSISAEDDCSLAGSGGLGYLLRLDSTPVTDNSFGFELDYEDCDTDSTQADSGATSAVIPVSAGAHTIHLDAAELGTGSFIQGRSITAVFVPTGSGSVIPAEASVSSPDENPNKPPEKK